MAHELKNAVPPTEAPTTAIPPHTPVAVPPELRLFRFSLRHLFWFVAVVSTLLGGIVASKGLTAAVLLLAALVVIAHLSATAIATRLRSHADEVKAWKTAADSTNPDGDFAAQQSSRRVPIRLGPRSPWHERGSILLPWLPRFVVGTVILGGVAGAALLQLTIGHRTSPAGIAVGAISVAVLSGWFAFLAGSFYGIFRRGFHEAVAEQQKDEASCRNSR